MASSFNSYLENRPKEGQPMIDPKNIISHGPKRLSNSCNSTRYRYGDDGKAIFVKRGKPKPVIYPEVVEQVKAKFEEGAKLGKPSEADSRLFDISQIRPLRGMVLCRNGEEVIQEGGVLIPEAFRKAGEIHQVVTIGPDTPTEFKQGDFVQLDRTASARAVKFDERHFFVTPAKSIVLIHLPPESDCQAASQPLIPPQ